MGWILAGLTTPHHGQVSTWPDLCTACYTFSNLALIGGIKWQPIFINLSVSLSNTFKLTARCQLASIQREWGSHFRWKWAISRGRRRKGKAVAKADTLNRMWDIGSFSDPCLGSLDCSASTESPLSPKKCTEQTPCSTTADSMHYLPLAEATIFRFLAPIVTTWACSVFLGHEAILIGWAVVACDSF